MSGHSATCGNCGQTIVIPCDKRQIGQGRYHDPDWKPGPNHELVRKALYMIGGWQTVKGVQAFLNHEVDTYGLKGGWSHQGRSIYWTQLAVEDPMSDLVGIDIVESKSMLKSRERMYRPNFAYAGNDEP